MFEDEDYESKNLHFEDFIHPQFLETLKRKKLTLNDLKRLYFKNEKISKDTTLNFIDLVGDMFFVEGIHRIAKVQAERNSASTYLYQFTYDQGPNLTKGMFNSDISGTYYIQFFIYNL